MKKYIQKINAYQFSELPRAAKDKVKDWYVSDTYRTDIFNEELTETLKAEYGLHQLDTFYSLSYCQGDGLCLYGYVSFQEIFNNEKFREIALKGLKTEQRESVRNILDKITFTHRGNYYYAESSVIDYQADYPTDKQIKILDQVCNNITAWYLEFCRIWEKYGYEFFYEISDEYMEDICNNNNYLFNETGNLIDVSCMVEVK